MRNRKTFQKPSLPEFLAFALFVYSVIITGLWWANYEVGEWRTTSGYVTASKANLVHYNAEDYRTRVELRYLYTVGGREYEGQWTGHWPQFSSPNALAEDQLEALSQEAYPLVVYYDPENLNLSELHVRHGGTGRRYANAAVAGYIAVGLYIALVYPRWKRRRGFRG